MMMNLVTIVACRVYTVPALCPIYSGTIGNGSRMKLCVNMILGTFVSGLAEGLSLADSVGLSQEDLWDILQQGAMACPVVTVKGKGASANNWYSCAWHFAML